MKQSERLMCLAGVEHAREGADGAAPGGEPQEGQPLRCGSGLGAEQHPRQGHRQGHRRSTLCKELISVPSAAQYLCLCMSFLLE